MTSTDACGYLAAALWQASWQGALFALLVGLFCLTVRIPAPLRAFLWLLAGIKFFVGFLWLISFGKGLPLDIALPAGLIPASQTGVNLSQDRISLDISWMVAAWSAGILLCGAVVYLRARATYRTVSHSTDHTGALIPAILAALARRMRVSPCRLPSVRVGQKQSDGPQVTLYGSRPVVILPAPLLPPSPTALTEEELRFVLAHELAHIRRGDLWAGLLMTVMEVVFFFHPAALWVKREWEAAREEACDLLALEGCAAGDRDTAARYGALLLRLGGGIFSNSAAAARIAPSPFAALRRRLTHLDYLQRQNRRFHLPAPLLLPGILLGILLLPIQPRWVIPANGSVPQPVIVRETHPVIGKRSVPAMPPRTVRISQSKSNVAVRRRVTETRVVQRDRPKAANVKRILTPVDAPIITRGPSTVPVQSGVLADVKPLSPAIAEPLQVMETRTIDHVSPGELIPSPVPVTPDTVPVASAPPRAASIAESAASTGDIAAPRPADMAGAHTSAASAEANGEQVAGRITLPGESTRSLTRPLPVPSPSPTPAPSDFPAREPDFVRPSPR